MKRNFCFTRHYSLSFPFVTSMPKPEPMPKVIIIDDEANAREHLRNLIEEHCPHLQVIGEADGIESGFQLIREMQPQAIFLDISMRDGTGFGLLDKFAQHTFQVIFQTAFDEFAIKAFRYNAVDYLLKPVSATDLVKAAGKIAASQDQDHPAITQQLFNLIDSAKKKKFEKIVLHSSEGMHFVKVADIQCLQADMNYTTFYITSGEKITVAKTIKTFEELLPERSFFRSHQSYIVNLNYVSKILKEGGGYALLEDGSKIPISRRKKDQFITALMGKASGT